MTVSLRNRRFGVVLAVLVVVVVLGVGACSVSAAVGGGPQWTVSSVSRPTNFRPGGDPDGDAFVVLVTNTGSVASNASEPVTITDELPEGLAPGPVAGVKAEDELASAQSGTGGIANFSEDCAVTGEGGFSCTYGAVVQPDDTLILTFPVKVAGGLPDSCGAVQLAASALSCAENVAQVSGGGAASAMMRTPTMISDTPAAFGLSPGGVATTLSSVQAGAHPDITTSASFNTENIGGATSGNVKNTVTDEPPGFALDLRDTPACLPAVFLQGLCPIATQVGIVTVLYLNNGLPSVAFSSLYNLPAEPGDVAKIAFSVAGEFHYEGDVSVRPPGEEGEYGGRVTFTDNTAGLVDVDSVSLTLWGVPSASVHDPLRTAPYPGGQGSFGHSSSAPPVPFFSNPTSCGAGPLVATFAATSWQHPNEIENAPATLMEFGPVVGCDRLGMEPKVTAEATTDRASAASGLDLNVNVPQTYDDAEGLATAALQKQVVTLPVGMTVNPSAGAGLAACSPAQFAQERAQYAQGVGCPNASKLGEVEIVTPLLAEHAKGSVFLAEPYDNPFGSPEHPGGSLIALYIVARIPGRGVLIEAPGEVQADPVTGQLVTTFDTSNPARPGGGLPPLPFSLLTFRFNQGAGSPLVTPPGCGLYTVQTQLTPYSDPEGLPLVPPISPFPITSGFDGGPCPAGGAPPFAPHVTAYPVHPNAGAYSPFYIDIARSDGEQEITGFASQFPPGLTGNLSGVPFCSEADVAAARAARGVEEEQRPSCPQASEIGYSIAEAGVGAVLAQAPGKIYLGGPYQGAPFSVVAITAAHVGPFDLGTVVIHFPLDIDPVTAAVSIPSGPADQIPHIIKGIVIHVRNIRAYISREKFMINPTSCAPFSFSATVIGGGADPTNPAGYDPVTATSPFQVADCANLQFAPKLTASSSGRTSRADGASLTVKLTYPPLPLGTQSNIKQVKVELPKQLPSRLTTLQRACTAKQFDTDPAGCPSESIIGHARAITPILPVALEGPAYFVSNGSEAFPNLVIVLQGDGVTIELTGDTFISKAGITSSTFKTVPDQPVTSFELTLPEGKFSALAANGNLCALTKTVTVKKKVTTRTRGHKRTTTRNVKTTEPQTLALPTEFVGQNGAQLHQSTPLTITDCAKHKTTSKKKKPHRGKKSRHSTGAKRKK